MYVTRSEWGAQPARGRYRLAASEVDGLALHWPAMGDARLGSVAEVARKLRDWQAYHFSKGWSDIAYQEAVDQAGNVYGLRGLRHRSAANGDELVNRRFGALLLVLGEGEQPTGDMIAAVRRRVTRWRQIYPDGRQLVGHRDIRPEPTECPGEIVARMIGGGVFLPNPPIVTQVEKGRSELHTARVHLRNASAELADAKPSRKAAHKAADQARQLARQVTDLLEGMPRS